jgi:predicted short-subunit dehydrogenase-like oxidoreductase (DUF2520 family)
MIRVGIIGAGNVGRVIAKALQQADIAICGISSKHPENASRFAAKIGTSAVSNWQEFSGADLIIVSVPDDEIQSILEQAASIAPSVSVSGTVSIQGINGTYPTGVFYPLQSFTAGRTIDLGTVPILIESKDQNLQDLLLHLGKNISNTVQLCSENDRKHLHLAAVFANNFTNHLLYQSERYCLENNVSFDLLKPLIRETLEKALELGPKAAQTGPARRHDKLTIDEHLSKLSDPAKAIYQLITGSIQSTYND